MEKLVQWADCGHSDAGLDFGQDLGQMATCGVKAGQPGIVIGSRGGDNGEDGALVDQVHVFNCHLPCRRRYPG